VTDSALYYKNTSKSMASGHLLAAAERTPTCGRTERAHKVVGKPHRTPFPTPSTGILLFINQNEGDISNEGSTGTFLTRLDTYRRPPLTPFAHAL
jgi:hypothetical protein